MNYLDICSGISAPTVAWKRLGWRALAFAETDPAPSKVLAYRYPDVENVGDFTAIKEGAYAADVLVGGTPCQDFSIAGLRAGLDGKRGQLTIEFTRLAARVRPRWLVWENVPGVLSADGGRAFGMLLGLLGQLGYGFAYRVLDAQHFGVPQRRRRVFLIGHLGDWRRAAAVLFERQSLSWHPAPGKEARQTAPTLPSRSTAGGGLGTDFDCDGGLIADTLPQAFGGNNTSGAIKISTALNACGSSAGRMDFESETFIVEPPIIARTLKANSGRNHIEDDYIAFKLRGREGGAMPEMAEMASLRAESGGSSRSYIAHTLRGQGFDASEDGTGRGTPLVRSDSKVRRFTPRECERLQDFEDDYTLVPNGRQMMSDSARYKMLGNSMAVPVIAWLGQRIEKIEACQ